MTEQAKNEQFFFRLLSTKIVAVGARKLYLSHFGVSKDLTPKLSQSVLSYRNLQPPNAF